MNRRSFIWGVVGALVLLAGSATAHEIYAPESPLTREQVREIIRQHEDLREAQSFASALYESQFLEGWYMTNPPEPHWSDGAPDRKAWVTWRSMRAYAEKGYLMEPVEPRRRIRHGHLDCNGKDMVTIYD